jgi:hypothetical protein
VQDIYKALSVGDIAGAFTNIDDHVEWIEAAGFLYTDTLLVDEAMKSG